MPMGQFAYFIGPSLISGEVGVILQTQAIFLSEVEDRQKKETQKREKRQLGKVWA